jgi:hypothetical protein
MIMKVRHYADGGKVEKPAPKPAPKPEPKPEEKRSLMDIMSGKTRREREKELGLKDGGKVKKRRRYADGGPVRKLPPSTPLPEPKRGAKPKRIGR